MVRFFGRGVVGLGGCDGGREGEGDPGEDKEERKGLCREARYSRKLEWFRARPQDESGV